MYILYIHIYICISFTCQIIHNVESIIIKSNAFKK